MIDALRKPGVIDELGFLMLNGAFADRLYPGVTTIMTRARYLVFVPAIYRHLESSRLGAGRDVDRVVRRMQVQLRDALSKNEKNFIGRDKPDPLRPPSAIYWNALQVLGIATEALSESTYQRRLSEGVFGPRSYADDDKVVHDDGEESLWNSKLRTGHVLKDGQFPETTRFRLDSKEAALLAARYAALNERPGIDNLVTRMVTLGRQVGSDVLGDIEHPWTIPGCSDALAWVLVHARRLSLMARGATLQYYAMVLERKKQDASGVADAFSRWLDEARPDLADWDVYEFSTLMTSWGAGRGLMDRQFISAWLDRIRMAKSGRAALSDSVARAQILERERRIRPGRERLKGRTHHLDTWSLPDGFDGSLYWMDYRHRVGRVIATDIVQGFEPETA